MNLVLSLLFFMFMQVPTPLAGHNLLQNKAPHVKQLAVEQISLEKRYDNQYVNNVFKDNILLNISYLAGKITKKEDINWKEIEKPTSYKFTLLPNKTFAFHNDVLEQYKNSVVKTTNANFNFNDGFKSDGYLTGDGVCHLASLIYWVAKNAGLTAFAPTSHDFAVIPQIDRKYGVSIYKGPGQSSSNEMQNLYVTNNKNKPIVFNFTYKNDQLKLSISEEAL